MKYTYTIYISHNSILRSRLIRSDNITSYTWRHMRSCYIKEGIDLDLQNTQNRWDPEDLERYFKKIKVVQGKKEFKEWFTEEYIEFLL